MIMRRSLNKPVQQRLHMIRITDPVLNSTEYLIFGRNGGFNGDGSVTEQIETLEEIKKTGFFW
jgi:hypothetical protein